MRPEMTLLKLEGQIKQGHGISVADRYTPLIAITRHGTSDVSNQNYVRIPSPMRKRCFLSPAKRHPAHVLSWIGAVDVREQVPLWPWAHPTLLSELDEHRKWSGQPDIVAVSRETGRRPHNCPSLAIPAVSTAHLMVTVSQDDGSSLRLIGVSCKPEDEYLQASPADRVRERLELDRCYCKVADIQHFSLRPEQLLAALIKRLDWLAPRCIKSELNRLQQSSTYRHFVDRIRTRVFSIPADQAIRAVSRAVARDERRGQRMAHTAIWTQDINVDVGTPMLMCAPLKSGGLHPREGIRDRIFGDRQCR